MCITYVCNSLSSRSLPRQTPSIHRSNFGIVPCPLPVSTSKSDPPLDCKPQMPRSRPLHIRARIGKIACKHCTPQSYSLASGLFLKALEIYGALMGLGIIVGTIGVKIKIDILVCNDLFVATQSTPAAFILPPLLPRLH